MVRATDHNYKQGSGDYLYIDVIDATDDTTFHPVACDGSFKSVDIHPIDAPVYLYVKATDTNYRTILDGTSLSIDLSNGDSDTVFYVRSSIATNRIEILFLK